MARARIKLHIRGFRQLRTDARIDAMVQAKAQAIAWSAGPGFAVRKSKGQTRARYHVHPTTPAAYKANKQYALVRAMATNRT